MEYMRTCPSPVGPITLTADETGLTGLYLRPPTEAETAFPWDSPYFPPALDYLERYFFGGDPSPRELTLSLTGTAFQRLIWQELLSIPYGSVCTYGELARRAARILGKEKMSAQAVGNAVGSNPISIIIPCHRVVSAGGKPGGYAWGLDKKLWLIRHEGGSYDR